MDFINFKIVYGNLFLRKKVNLITTPCKTDDTKGYKPEGTNPKNCKKLVSYFIQLSKQRFILCQTWVTVTLTVQCCNLVNFSGIKIKGYFIFNFTLKYLKFSMLWVGHFWLVTLHIWYEPETNSCYSFFVDHKCHLNAYTSFGPETYEH
jgi:hypothetical protein